MQAHSWYVKLSIKPSQLENFRALTGEMVNSTRRELGVLPTSFL
jgi:quinol monooxygenase YgiN